jgi:hypothetical protein
LIHTAAYWLMLSLRGLAPRISFRRDAQFDTIRLCLIKVAGRVTEMVTRIKIALPTAFLSGRFLPPRRAHRQITAVNDGAGRPRTNPSVQPQTQLSSVSDATGNDAPMGETAQPTRTPMNDPG